MEWRPRTWGLAIVAALTLATALAVASGVGDGGTGDGAPAEPPATGPPAGPPSPGVAPGASTAPSLPGTTTTVPPSTTNTTVPSTTTTLPPSTTTSVGPISEPNGYTWIPKPGAGYRSVAPGGALTKHLAADIAAAFGFTTAEVEAAISAVALPPEAEGSPEGWLAPGTYDPAEGDGAAEIVQAMVDRRVMQFEERGIPRDRWHRVLTAASIVETETYNQNEKPRVARVLTNRLAGGGPLQMDSIILYPVPEDRIFTTSDERASDQPYNSYKHDGLPPTPICSPDEESIDAFLAPPPGDWWFYVTVDLSTGETRYAVTYEEHQANVRLMQAWLRENPIP